MELREPGHAIEQDVGHHVQDAVVCVPRPWSRNMQRCLPHLLSRPAVPVAVQCGVRRALTSRCGVACARPRCRRPVQGRAARCAQAGIRTGRYRFRRRRGLREQCTAVPRAGALAWCPVHGVVVGRALAVRGIAHRRAASRSQSHAVPTHLRFRDVHDCSKSVTTRSSSCTLARTRKRSTTGRGRCWITTTAPARRER